MTDQSMEKIQAMVAGLLEEIGEDGTREGLVKTPERVARSWAYFAQGYSQNLKEVVGDACFDVEYDEMVTVKDIEFFSMCEHHLLPFFGKAHIGYIPKAKVIGLSKLPRIVEMFARRLQVQERLTVQIGNAVKEILDPAGVGVVLEGAHLCMQMRGVEKKNSYTTTSHMLGVFRDNSNTRQEFLKIISMGGL